MKALLWDNDGVLVDTERLYFEVTREVLAEVGVELTRDLYIEWSLRQGRSCFDLAAGRGIPGERVDVLRDVRNARYSKRLSRGVALMPGVRATLRALHGRFPMAIVTSARPEHFAAMHGSTGLEAFFEFVLTPDLYEKHKPHPEPYLAAAERLGVAPHDCLVVEDTARGLAAAVAAGMRCVVVPHDLTRGQDFVSAYRVLGGAAELPAIVDTLAG